MYARAGKHDGQIFIDNGEIVGDRLTEAFFSDAVNARTTAFLGEILRH